MTELPEGAAPAQGEVTKHPPRCLRRSQWRKLEEWKADISDKTERSLLAATAASESARRIEETMRSFMEHVNANMQMLNVRITSVVENQSAITSRLDSVASNQELIFGGAGKTATSIESRLSDVIKRVDLNDARRNGRIDTWKAVLLLVIGAAASAAAPALIQALQAWMK